MKVLVVGAGGREHALAYALKKSPQCQSLAVTPGNGGIAQIAECWGLTDLDQIVSRAQAEGIGLVFAGQEDYLVQGLADQLEAAGIMVVGPSAAAAALEGSKAFAKAFMARHQIPTSGYQAFTSATPAKQFLATLSAPYVIKASGLAAGKGVVIAEDLASAEAAVDEMLGGKFGEAGETLVIEEFMPGEEASYFVFTDGKDYLSLPSLQDHKRVFELDRGPNTGGMGCYSPAPILSPEVEEQVKQEVVEPTIKGMAADGHPYKGVLYIGLMIHQGRAKVVEYNIRFGDPECQPLMMLFDADLVRLGEKLAQGRLKEFEARWKPQAAACVVLASGGYPGPYAQGQVIQGLEEVECNDELQVFHAGTAADSNRFKTNGGRVLAVTALGETLQAALDKAYAAAAHIHWPGMQLRRDIGLKGLKKGVPTGKKVGIIMGSASDMKVAQKGTKLLDQFGIRYEVIVSSAHRTPERTRDTLHRWHREGVEVFIAIAGMAAHLPGVVASETGLPVIGVPASGSALSGQDALLAVVQMPPGIPVATVGIDRGDNAAVLALQILSIKYPALKAVHVEYRLQMEQAVIASSPENQ
ncbi:MAG: phosphoribosylamine--glycine ligase [bacterium]|nr:phosphoribosylamine--glycine ligase [bacterium]